MKKYDLLVVGGGLTGVAAAVAAARQGLQVLLAEQSGCLGGALSTNLIYPFMPFSTRPEPGVRKDLSAGLFKEIFLRSQAITAKIGPASVEYPEPSMSTSRSDICHEHVKFALDDMVQEAGVSVPDAVYMMTETPAQVMGLQNKGRLAEGFDADLVVFDDDIHVQQVFALGRAVL